MEVLLQDQGSCVDSDKSHGSNPQAFLTGKALLLFKRACKLRKVQLLNQCLSQLAQQKQLGLARNIFEQFFKVCPEEKPDCVTFSTMINASVRCWEVKQAECFHEEMINTYSIAPNQVTLTTLLKGYCQDGDIERGFKFVQEVFPQYHVVPNVRTFNTLLRGCLRTGSIKVGRAVHAYMRKHKILMDTSSYVYVIKLFSLAFLTDTAWKLVAVMQSKNMLADNPTIFADLALSCALQCKFSEAKSAIDACYSVIRNRAVARYDNKQVEACTENKNPSSTLFIQTRNREAQTLCASVNTFINHLDSGSLQFKAVPSIHNTTDVLFFSCIPSSPSFLNLANVFSNTNPVVFEVCSGHGEWITEKAQNEPDNNFLALEMRFDRVFQIWASSILKGLKNLKVICGEASNIFEHYIPPNSISEVYINFPDPPVWKQSPRRLINCSFLQQIHRIMTGNGSISILTDDKQYCQTIVEEFDAIPCKMFESEFKQKQYSNTVPVGYGSSYFDRFWQRGKRSKRYYHHYYKVGLPNKDLQDNLAAKPESKSRRMRKKRKCVEF